MTNAETFLNIFSGAQNKYGKCYQYIKETGEKLTRKRLVNNRTTFKWKELLGRFL